jgi:hypothetical protein
VSYAHSLREARMQRPNSRVILPGRVRLVRVVNVNVVAPALNHNTDRPHALAGIVERPSSARGGATGLRRGTFAIGAKVAVATEALPIAHGVVTECRNTSHNSLLRIGNANGSCPKGQSAIRFNATGPRGSTGVPGAPGATGATGPAGPSGIVDGVSYGSSPVPWYSDVRTAP